MPNTVFITGSSSGIGLCVAHLFQAKGWNVIATMRAPNYNVLPSSDKVLVLALDVKVIQSITTAIDIGIRTFGRIDVLVNCCGEMQLGLFESIPPQKVLAQFETNVIGPMNVIRALLPHFRSKQSGVILNVTASQGLAGYPMASIYSASKFALEGYTEALSYELSSVGVVAKTIIPQGESCPRHILKDSSQLTSTPGTVANTNFISKAQRNMATNQHAVPEYASFVNKTFEMLSSSEGGFKPTIAVEDVARKIWEAATDGTTKLRYFVGANQAMLLARYRAANDEEYMLCMRAYYNVSG